MYIVKVTGGNFKNYRPVAYTINLMLGGVRTLLCYVAILKLFSVSTLAAVVVVVVQSTSHTAA